MIVLDTIAFNTFIDLKKNREVKHDPNVNLDEFKKLIEGYSDGIGVHSGSLLELFVKYLRSEDSNNFYNFIEDYNELSRNNIQLLNEQDAFFDWELLKNLIDDSKVINLEFLLKKKIEFETDNIARYFDLINLILVEILFDKYGESINEDMYRRFLICLREVIIKYTEKYLQDYYLVKNIKKELITKQLDRLLALVVTQMEKVVKNKEEYGVKYLLRPDETIIEIFNNVESILEDTNTSGITLVKKVLTGEKYKGEKLRALITSKINEFEEHKKVNNRRTLTGSEKKYLVEVLLENSFHNGSKVTKNDFTDCMILSSLDLLNRKDLIFITFDKKLKNFMKNNNIYYNEEIYSRITR